MKRFLNGQSRRSSPSAPLHLCLAPHTLALAVAMAIAAPSAWSACQGGGDVTVRARIIGPCYLTAPGTLRVTQPGSVVSTDGPGVVVSGVNGAVSILNAGSLAGTQGVTLDGSQLSGNLTNYRTGSILGNIPSTDAVIIANSRLSQGLVNNGSIQGGISQGMGVNIHDSVLGTVRNRGDISGASYGMNILDSTVNGDVLNSASMESRYSEGLAINASKVNGNVASTGSLRGNHFGLAVTSSTVSGDVLTAGTIHAGSQGVRVAFSTLGGNLITQGTITSDYGGVEATGSKIAGDVINRASVNAVVGMVVNGQVTGNVANAGNINTSSYGMALYSANIRGLMQNSGSINVGGGVIQTVGGQAAMGVFFASRVAGVYNTGTITTDGLAGIQVTDTGSVTRRGIRNLGGDITAHVGIDLAAAPVAGGIINTGSINATDNSGDGTGVRITDSQVSGGLANAGSISGSNAAVALAGSTLTGSLRNTGSLEGVGAGITLADSTLDGSLLNSGSLRADGDALRIERSHLTGSLVNSGEVSGTDTGLDLNFLSLDGDLSNSGNIGAHTRAMSLINSTVTGAVSNTGTLTAPAGLIIATSNIQSFSNRGLISGGSDGVATLINSRVHGNFVNAGTMRGVSDTPYTLLVQDSQIEGVLVNSGRIEGPRALTVINSGIAQGLNISGSLLGDPLGGYALYVDDDTELETITLSGRDTARITGLVRAHSSNAEVAKGSTFTLQDGNRFEVVNFNNFGNLAVAAQGADPADPDTPAHAGVATIKGSYTQSADATLTTRVLDGQNYGHLVVLGTATLPSQARVYVDVSNPSQPFSISRLDNVISARSLVSDGTYQVSSNSQLFNFIGQKDGNTVDLALATKPGSSARSAVAANAQAQGAARVLDAQFAGGQRSALTPYFVSATSAAEVANAVAQSLPLTSTLPASQFMQEQIIESLRDRLDDSDSTPAGLASRPPGGLWLKPFGARLASTQRGADGSSLASVGGTLLGADAALSPDTRLGVAFAYGNSGADAALGGTGQRAQTELYQFSAYASHQLDTDTELNLHAGMGQSTSDGRRTLDFGGSRGQAKSHFDSQAITTGMSLSQRYDLSETTRLTPSLSADYLRIHDEAYRERGASTLAPLLLDVAARSTDQLLVGFDTRLSHDLAAGSQFKARLGVAYDVLSQPNEVTASYAGAPGQRFTTAGEDLGAWVLRGGLEFTARSSGGTALSLSWNAQTRSGLAQQVGMLQVSKAL